MSRNNTEPSVTFKYIFPYDYNPVFVNGAHGGVSPRGELIANFYLERHPLPSEITHAITKEGAIGDVTAVDPDDLHSSMVRYVPCGIVLNYENAVNLNKWLSDNIAEMKRILQARSEMSGGQPQE
jgi:hypothetical protein